MTDEAFAHAFADMAFSDKLKDREEVAWLLFARINQLIADKVGVSERSTVPVWMAWATKDTFNNARRFLYNETNRADLIPVTEKKILAGEVSLDGFPDGANKGK